MLTRRESVQLKLHCITIEELVPANHFLRKLEAAVDFSFIYDEVRDLYCPDNGRPGMDPVMLVKYLLVGYLYGIESERRIEQEIQVNMAYRWFLGLDLDERVPDHSTISQNRRRRFNGANLFRRFFENILMQCIKRGLVDGKMILTDSTHVKACASSKRNIKVEVERETTDYMQRLDKYEAEGRERLEASRAIKPQRIKHEKRPRITERTANTADPDAGLLGRPGKPDGMHYLSHQSVDAAHGIVVDVAVTSGNTNDSQPYLNRIEHMRDHIGLDIQIAGADSSYGTSLIYRAMEDMGIVLHTPESSTGGVTYKVEFTRELFEYDEQHDRFICPAQKYLTLRSLERENFNVCRTYRADRNDCKACPMINKCVSDSQRSRTIRMNIFEQSVRRQRAMDATPQHEHILNLRQVWCEGTFAAQKWMHNLRRLFRRGLEAAEDHCLPSVIALNLKRMVKCLG